MLGKTKKIHFVGIKGVAMSALAIICKQAGFNVVGSDVAEEFITDKILAEKGKDGDIYHLCSGKAQKIRYILDQVLSLSANSIEVRRNPKLMRPSETPRLVGDFSKARRVAGYKPTYKLTDTLRDTLDYWRTVVRRSKN